MRLLFNKENKVQCKPLDMLSLFFPWPACLDARVLAVLVEIITEDMATLVMEDMVMPAIANPNGIRL